MHSRWSLKTVCLSSNRIARFAKPTKSRQEPCRFRSNSNPRRAAASSFTTTMARPPRSPGLLSANTRRRRRSQQNSRVRPALLLDEDHGRVRKYAAEQGIAEEEALAKGMEEKSKEFVEKG